MPATTIRSAQRALDLLVAVCKNPGINLTQAAQLTELSPSSALRLLNTLVEKDFICRDKTGLFHVGSEMIHLGFNVLSENNLRTIARPIMNELAETTGESIYLSVKQQDRALYIGVATGSHAVQYRSWEGQTIPLKETAVGAVLTGKVASNDYVAVSNGVERDVLAIASPIVAGNETIAALSMLVPQYRLDQKLTAEHGKLIARQAKKLAELF